MRLARVALAAAALGFAAFGVLLMIEPAALELAGVHAPGSWGRIELRAFYGGLELGLALFFVLAMRRAAWVRAALVLQVCAFGGVAGARGLALLLAAGEANTLIYLSWVGEIAMAAFGAIALRRLGPAGEAEP